MTTYPDGTISVNIEEQTPLIIVKGGWLVKEYATTAITLSCSVYCIKATAQYLLEISVIYCIETTFSVLNFFLVSLAEFMSCSGIGNVLTFHRVSWDNIKTVDSYS